MPDIKIFVSHRIDMNSELIPNPLYVPVRCGAVFDKENPMGIMGDDTGDNISDRRMSFSEFTVQYWAWKNVQTDYYGLCHYRRYLSFAEERFPEDEYGMVPLFHLDQKKAVRLGLTDPEHMAEVIGQYDIVLSEKAPLDRYPTPKGAVKTVRELWEAHEGLFITAEAIDEMFSLIRQLAPQYSNAAEEYFNGPYHRGYNCYIMKRELFDRLCSFQFPILFEMEKWLKTRPYRDTLSRIPGYIGEMLYGIFTYHILTYENWKVKELQLVLFKNTQQVENPIDIVKIYISYGINWVIRGIANFVLPIGTRRRMTVKKFWYQLKERKNKDA